ncbi:hypothetical protein PULV_a0070 [Pseudoalteromonas ulvae UL12]|uniref:DUF1543 domain-containing protein n=1 Tax=Pseudoalteromonas ulvae TaxID=107327 RepID=A0A244CV28_PSEDV|nr:DUF1543 domain-containing protein [Pseudoalteromonas ulvae]MBE0362556.1 hypothetical protein [Pseudoalteromonas ulvae UL12]OUL59487.1 hypothetical protein B1199_04255 [Pseudoalteromonas ulvae]
MNLFLTYLGGRITGGNIEIHDVQFVVGPNIEHTFSELKQRWIGNKNSVHLDAYITLRYVDGYSITIANEPQDTQLSLYFVNIGGYQKDKIAEQHEFGVFVATSEAHAISRAKQQLLRNTELQHKDDSYDIDDCFKVSLFDLHQYIHLTPTPHTQAFIPDWYGYHVL